MAISKELTVSDSECRERIYFFCRTFKNDFVYQPGKKQIGKNFVLCTPILRDLFDIQFTYMCIIRRYLFV